MSTGQELADVGISQSDKNASEAWRVEARLAFRRVARRQRRFTTDDVLAEIEQSGVPTHNLSAIGAVVKEAVKEGIIQPVLVYVPPYGQIQVFIKSNRPTCHKKPVGLWQSLVSLTPAASPLKRDFPSDEDFAACQ